jgi:hypothetical protein
MWFGPNNPKEFLDQEINTQLWSKISLIKTFNSKMDSKNAVVVVNNETWTETDIDIFVKAFKSLASRLEGDG